MAILALVPLLAMAVLAARSAQRVRDESEVEANLEFARATAAAFAGFVGDVQRTGLALGEALATRRLSPREATRLLGRALRAYDALLDISWATPAGEIVQSSDPASPGLRVGDRDYFLRILAGDDTAVSDGIETTSGQGLVFVVAVAVRDPERRLVGVVLAPIEAARLPQHALALPRSGTGGYALVDRGGRIVVRTPALEMPPDRLEIASRESLVARALAGEEAAGAFVAEDGSDQVGAAVPIPGTGWVARASRDAAEVRAPIRREVARAGLVALVAAGAWLFTAALLGGRISRAIARLAAHAEALGRGERVTPPRLFLREMERLARTYGNMADRLRASREAFQTALDATPAGIVVVDGTTLRARWANPAFLALLDEPWRSRGVVGSSIEEYVPRAERSGLAERLRRVASGELPDADGEDRYDGLARGPTWLRWSLRAIPSSLRLGARDLLFLATDVTEQVRARRAVEEDRGRLETVLRTLPVGVLIADPSGAIALSNEAARRILGRVPSPLSRAEALRLLRGWRAASGAPLAPGDWPLSRALARETVHGEMLDVALRDGRRASLLVSAAPILDASGGVAGAVAAFEDVTDLRRSQRRERLLHEAAAALGETLDFEDVARRLAAIAVPEIADACSIDEALPDGTLRELAATRGAAGETCSGAAPFRVVLAWRAIATRAPAPARAGEPSAADPEGCALADAGLRSAVAVPLMAGGHVLGVLTVATGAERPPLDGDDVRAAQELGRIAAHALGNARLFDEIRRAVRARDEVLSVVTHDLRTPLGAVTFGSRVLVELPDAAGALDRARATGARMRRAGERMARLIDDLLDLASLRAGRLELRRARWNPEELLDEAAEEVRPAARAKGLELRVGAALELPAIACDRGRILQVIGNLASNAVKATARGEVRLAAEPGDGEVVFSVADTGPGIPEAEQAAVFERFRRGAGVPYRGSGLGLSIARALVEAHGGRIWIESRLGAGTVMRFTLPAEGAARDAPQRPAGTSTGTAAAGL